MGLFYVVFFFFPPKILRRGAVLRWQRNKMGRSLSPQQIHQRTFERWVNSTKQLLSAGREYQAPRKATHCLRKEVGQNIKDKKRDKRGRDGDPSWEGSLKKERSFQIPGNTLTGESVVSLGTSKGNITRRKNKWLNPTDYVPNGNPQPRSSTEACIHH